MNKASFSPLAATFCTMVGAALLTSMVSLTLHGFGRSDYEIGIAQAAYYLGLLLGALTIQKLVLRIGHIQMLTFSGALLSLMVVILALFDSMFLWCFARFFCGVGMASLYVVVESWLLDESDEAKRSHVMTLYMVSLNIGYAVAQQFVSHLDTKTQDPFFVSIFFFCASVMAVALSTQKITKPHAKTPVLELKTLLNSSFFGVLACFCVGLITSSSYSFLILLAPHYYADGPLVMTAFGLGGLFGQWPLSKLALIFKKKHVMLMQAIGVFFFGVMALCQIAPLAFLIFFFAWIFHPLYSISLTYVIEGQEKEKILNVSSALLFMYGLGSFLGPLIASVILTQCGPSGLFILYTAVGVMLTGFGIRAL